MAKFLTITMWIMVSVVSGWAQTGKLVSITRSHFKTLRKTIMKQAI